jgi:hypothetical protein
VPANQEKRSATCYEIQVSGRLGKEWTAWFGQMTVTARHTPEGAAITVLSGPVPDRAALFGILNRIRDLGLKLISVNQVAPVAQDRIDVIQEED